MTETVTSVAQATDLVNLSGLEELLERLQIDAFVCRSGMNVSYLSGIASPGTLGRHLDLADTPREVFVIWPAAGDPIVVLSEIASQLARATSRIARHEIYRDYADSPEEKLATTLRDLGLAGPGGGLALAWLGPRRWNTLERLLPDLKAVDCTDGLDLV